MKRHFKIISIIVFITLLFSNFPFAALASTLKIISIKNITASVYINQSYSLPKTVDATMSNKTSKKVSITWNPKTATTSKAGTYVHKGTVKGYTKKISLTLKVLPIDEEIKRAISYGFVPKELQSDYGKSVTYTEFCSMLSNLIKKATPEKYSDWKGLASKALTSNKVMRRDDAAVALLYASKAIGILYTNATNYPEIKKIQDNSDSWKYNEIYTIWPSWKKDFKMTTIIPGTGDKYENGSWGSVMGTAFWFVLLRLSQVNQKPLLDWDNNYNMRFYENITRREAIVAILRLGESEANLLDENNYISIYDVGSYDKTIITDKLLNQPSDLPEPVQSALPTNWKGAGVSARKDGRHYYKEFQESDIAFLAENGFNFARIFLGFITLRYPDNPVDEKLINKSELEDMDKLIAWGIQYDVHIQLSMIDTPNGEESFDISDGEWEMIHHYWVALAKRYATIPSRYLSFDLVNEIYPREDKNFDRAVEWMERINTDIHTASPSRVTLVSHTGTPSMKWVEAMAKAGIAIGCHPYLPTYMVTGDDVNLYHTAEAYWPYPYFPADINYGDTITITGDIGGNTLRMDFWVYEPFTVIFDNGQKQTVRVQGDYYDEMTGGWRFKEALSITIPAGVKKMTIQVERNTFILNELGLTDKAKKVRWLAPHDYGEGTLGNAELIWNVNKGWSSEKNCTVDFIFTQKIQPMLDISKKYKVGFMCNEFGVYACNMDGWNVSTITAYYEDMLKMFEQQAISWCLCEAEGFPYRFLTMPVITYNTYEWVGATLTVRNYTFPDGHSRQLYQCEELMKVFRKYL